MAYSFADLTTPMTRQEVQASIYSAIATTGINTTAWKPGAVVRTMIVGMSIVMAAITSFAALIARSGFLEFSAGDWLTAVAKYVYGIDRELATFATGEVTLNNTGGGVYVVEAGDLLVTNMTTGKGYRNTVGFTLGSMQHDLPPVAIIALEAGSDSNSAAGTITQITTLPASVTCTNALDIGALDREEDPELRTRCYESRGALSPMGPWDAYSSAIKNARRANGTKLGITRVHITKDGFGNVTVYVATATGAVEAPDVEVAQLAVDKFAEPLAVTATVVSAVAVAVNVVHETWCYNTSSQTPTQIEAAIFSALRAYVRTQPISGNKLDPGDATGKVYRDALRAVIGGSLPSLIVHTDLTTPASDLDFAVNEVPVLGTVSTTLHQIPTPEGHAP